MNKIKEKVLEEIAERFKELNKNSQNVVDFLLRVDREIPKFVEKAIKLTAKEIRKDIEKEHNKIKAEIKKPLRNREDWFNKIWDRAYLSGLIFVEEKLKKSWGVKDEN